MKRKGISQTIEAVIGGILLLSFIIVVVPSFTPTQDPGESAVINTYNALAAVDRAGTLDNAVVNRDVEQVKSVLQPSFPARNIEAVLTWTNSSSADIHVDGQATRTIQVNASTLATGVLRVWLRDASAVNISVNGRNVLNTTTHITGAYRTIDVTGQLRHGSNTLTVDAAQASLIGYSLDREHEIVSGEPPVGRDTYTATRILPGSGTNLVPTVVTVIVW